MLNGLRVFYFWAWLSIFAVPSAVLAEIASPGSGVQSAIGRGFQNLMGGPSRDSTNYMATTVDASYFKSNDTHLTFMKKFNQLAANPELKGSEKALERALAFYYKHKNGISNECGSATTKGAIRSPWVVVTDYTKPIDEPRQFYINVETNEVKASYASHGYGSNEPLSACPTDMVYECKYPSGEVAKKCKIPVNFKDVPGSGRTERGFFLTGEGYTSSKVGFKLGNPPSPTGSVNGIRLLGLNSTNTNALDRGVVYHRASYPGTNVCANTAGCPATDPQTFEDMKEQLQNGALFYNHTIDDEAGAPEC